MTKTKRIPKDLYFMLLAVDVSLRSTCLRHKIGSVIVKNGQVISTGYNGAPSGLDHCLELGCLRDKLKIPSGERIEVCRAVHSEVNAVIQAAANGVDMNGASLFCTHKPCISCTKMLINCGIKKIFYLEDYPNELGDKLLAQASVESTKLDKKDLEKWIRKRL